VVNVLRLYRRQAFTGFAASREKAIGMNSPTAVSAKSHRKEDLIYQVVTVVAMVSLLASVWIF